MRKTISLKRAIYRDVLPQQSLPPPLSFVLNGAWQIGKGLEAVYRKLWNTMNGAGTDPHPPKKIACSTVEGPWRETDGARSPGSDPSIVSFFPSQKKRQCSQGVQNPEKGKTEAEGGGTRTKPG